MSEDSDSTSCQQDKPKSLLTLMEESSKSLLIKALEDLQKYFRTKNCK